MAELVWDRIEDRTFETGIERGVLFPLNAPAEAWNGLVSITEGKAREVKSYYLDGVKYLDHYVPGSYSAQVQAYTYPDALDAILGIAEFAPGVHVHDQPVGMFHLAYRTLIGNPVDGTEHGYKLHLVWNLTANPSDVTYATVSESVTPNLFEWAISGIQTSMIGIRPANHLSFDSRTIDPDLLESIEADIYGTDLVDPVMPDFVTLLATIEEMTA